MLEKLRSHKRITLFTALVAGLGLVTLLGAGGVPSNTWSLFGNRTSNPEEDYLGTSDEVGLSLRTHKVERMLFSPDGLATIKADTTITGTTTLEDTLDVDGATSLNSTLDVDGATSLNSTLDVDGATSLNSTLDVDGATSLNSTLDVDGATGLNSTLDVDGATSLNSSLDVAGLTHITNSTDSTNQITGALVVDGGVGIAKRLNVTGDASIPNLNTDELIFINFTSETVTVTGGKNAVEPLLDVHGRTRTDILEIDGGADIAEPFDVSGSVAVRPGMVVAIDPKEVGKLRIADTAYDAAVAGIISGANGIRSGMVLRQEGSVADGKHPVALTGRVWCHCDADANGPIQAGNMLTTSVTPGYAMKATDHSRMQGAIIGKAMSSLQSGKGLVLVLVSLQ